MSGGETTEEEEAAPGPSRGSTGQGPRTRTVTVGNERGLHARAAAKFVKLAGRFDAEITASKGGQTVSGLSIMGLMMLAAGPASAVELRATGPQADEALDALCHLVESKFEDE